MMAIIELKPDRRDTRETIEGRTFSPGNFTETDTSDFGGRRWPGENFIEELPAMERVSEGGGSGNFQVGDDEIQWQGVLGTMSAPIENEFIESTKVHSTQGIILPRCCPWRRRSMKKPVLGW